MAQPATCRRCNERVKLDAPLDVKMMVYQGIVPLICRSCLINESVTIERVGPQERAWYDGEKYLGYGDSFIRI